MSFRMMSGKLQLAFIHINLFNTNKAIHYTQSPLIPTESLVYNFGHNVGTWDGKKEAQKIDIVWTDETGHKELKN